MHMRGSNKAEDPNSYLCCVSLFVQVLHRFDQGIRAMKQYGPQSTFLGSLLTFALSMEGDYRATLSAEATMYNVTAGLLLTISVPAFLMPPSLDYGGGDYDTNSVSKAEPLCSFKTSFLFSYLFSKSTKKYRYISMI